MSTVNVETRTLTGFRDPTARLSVRPVVRDGTRAPATRDDSADVATTGGDDASALPITGKVYALKDGSGYVALASDGHYYKLDTAGSGFIYASASGVVDASVVDIAGGPVRNVRGTPARTAPHPHADNAHLADTKDPDARNSHADGVHAFTRRSGGHDTSDGPGTKPNVRASVGIGTPPATESHTKPSTDASAPDDAAALARATLGLMAHDPDATVRSHARVCRRLVALLLR